MNVYRISKMENVNNLCLSYSRPSVQQHGKLKKIIVKMQTQLGLITFDHTVILRGL